ncbi:porin [Phytohalomonas tamaricis]|uniref:porin n=1 Tax=Phytohalomonas tamaricis TaxID=2081032 RepID=UPI000D0B2D9B|nr:porin [Phytohalomonas tamaricis]
MSNSAWVVGARAMISLRYLMICLLALLPASAWAQTWLDSDRLTFSGFGTLGVVHNNSDEADFVSDLGQPKGAGEGWSARVDTLLGAQARLKLNEQFDIMAQGISRYHYTGNFRPELSWAFVRYIPAPDWQLRAGRLGLDSYLLSDSRHVGYAYPWLRPPVDHFGILQLDYIEGVDATYRRPLGDGLAWAKLFVGRSKSHVVLTDDLSAEIDIDHVYGGHLNYATGSWQFRVSYTKSDSETNFSGDYTGGVDNVYALLTYQLIKQAFVYRSMQLYSLGMIYEPGAWQLQAMRNQSETDENGIIDSGFASAGYRVGPTTPYVMFSRVWTSFPGIPAGQSFEQQTWSLGLRYDVASNLALKTQVDRVHVHKPGLLWRDTGADWDSGGGHVTLVSFGLDFVF